MNASGYNAFVADDAEVIPTRCNAASNPVIAVCCRLLISPYHDLHRRQSPRSERLDACELLSTSVGQCEPLQPGAETGNFLCISRLHYSIIRACPFMSHVHVIEIKFMLQHGSQPWSWHQNTELSGCEATQSCVTTGGCGEQALHEHDDEYDDEGCAVRDEKGPNDKVTKHFSGFST
jgi:hypothetical protein